MPRLSRDEPKRTVTMFYSFNLLDQIKEIELHYIKVHKIKRKAVFSEVVRMLIEMGMKEYKKRNKESMERIQEDVQQEADFIGSEFLVSHIPSIDGIRLSEDD